MDHRLFLSFSLYTTFWMLNWYSQLGQWDYGTSQNRWIMCCIPNRNSNHQWMKDINWYEYLSTKFIIQLKVFLLFQSFLLWYHNLLLMEKIAYSFSTCSIHHVFFHWSFMKSMQKKKNQQCIYTCLEDLTFPKLTLISIT